MRLWRAVLAVAALAGLAIGQAAEARELRILNWSEYIDQDDPPAGVSEEAWEQRPIEERSPTLRDFAKAHGCRMVYVEYDSPEQILARITSQPGYWDLVVLDAAQASTLMDGRKLLPLDPTEIPNLRLIPEEHRKCSFDPGRAYSAPWLIGSVGIAWRKDLLGEISSFAQILKTPPDALKGRLALLDDGGAVVGSMLRALGKSGHATDARNLRDAARQLDALKSGGFLAAVTGDVDEQGKGLKSGAFAAALVYSGDGLSIAAEDPERIGYVTPEEGSFWYVDSLAILADAPHPALAQKFVQHVLEPAVHARLATKLLYQCPNTEGVKLVPSDLFSNPGIYPQEPVRSRMEIYSLRETEAMDRILLRLKGD